MGAQGTCPLSEHVPAEHYASRWDAEKEFKTPEQITELGIAFFSKPEGPEWEALLLELLQSFHGYITKYLHMIVRGHVPYYAGTINEDARIFLQRFLPKGTEANRTTLLNACRSLHLAFKGADAGEVYDILVMCLLRAINKWDPHYTEKVREIVNVIDTKFPPRKQFTAFQLNPELGLDGTGIARMFARRGFPEPVYPGTFRGRPTTRMKSLPEHVSLQYTQEMLEPLLAALHQQDTSELFLSVAPGLAQRAYRLVEAALRRILQQGWYAGRRGRVSKLLIDAAGSLQQAMHTADADTATRHVTLAAKHVRCALASCHSIAARPRRGAS